MNLIQVQIKINKFTLYAILSEKNLHRLGWQKVPELKLSKKNIDPKFERLVEKLKTQLEEKIKRKIIKFRKIVLKKFTNFIR